jgi:hypothetical protein
LGSDIIEVILIIGVNILVSVYRPVIRHHNSSLMQLEYAGSAGAVTLYDELARVQHEYEKL